MNRWEEDKRKQRAGSGELLPPTLSSCLPFFYNVRTNKRFTTQIMLVGPNT